MPIEIGGISLNRIHKISTLEVADFASHRIPGLDGNVVQNMGRNSVRLQVEGIFYGDDAQDDLETLRELYKAREEVDFLAEIVGQAYFSQVVIERFEVEQSAVFPEQFSFLLVVAEYVPPPEPESELELSDVDQDIKLEALDFMDIAQLPDLLGSVPEINDPTLPLKGILDQTKDALSDLEDIGNDIDDLFGE